MKVIIGVLNSKYIHASLSPWCLAAGVRAFGKRTYEVEVAESTINADLNAFSKQLIAKAPDVLALSCYIWNIRETLSIARTIKDALGCIVVLGGPEVAYRPEDILQKYPYIDYVLGGEGEFTFPKFLEMVEGIRLKEDTEALSYRTDGGTCTTAENHHTQTPPSPYSKEYFASLESRISYIETSRGCPYRCAFCLSGRVSPLRFFDIYQVKQNILSLACGGSKTIKFVDRTFNANALRANEILSFILKHYGKEIPGGVCFHFEIAGDILKESTLALLSHFPVGAVQLEIGMQSFNENTLSAVNRKTDTKKLTDNIRRLIEMKNMHIHIDLIVGLTGEDIQSFEKSFDTGYRLGAHMLQMGFLKLLHGALMRQDQKKYPCTFSDEPPYEVTATPWLSAAEITALKNCEDALQRLYNSGRFLFTLKYLINEVGLTPFSLFYQFGQQVSGTHLSVGEYALALLECFQEVCDGQILKEKILCDLLVCAAWTQIPPQLKNPHPAYKQLKRQLCRHGNIKLAILPLQNTVFAVDYQGARDLHGRLPFRMYHIDFVSENVYNIKEYKKEEYK